MVIKKKIINKFRLLCILFITMGASAQINTTVNDLMSSDKILKSKALSNLILEKQVEVFPVLEAINSKKLFEFEGRLVTLGEKKLKKDEKVYTLKYLYPEVTIAKNTEGKELEIPLNQLRAIKFSRKDRLGIIPLLPYINLTSLDEDVRKLAYTQFQNKAKYEDLAILEKATTKETNKELLCFANETTLLLKLNNTTNPKKQLGYLNALTENKGDNTIALLKEFLKGNTNLSEEVKLQTKKSINSLESRSTRIDWIQNLFSGLSLGSILILISLGLAIVYGLAGVINMAHGEFMMIGAYTTFCVQELFKSISGGDIGDTFFWISLPISFVISGLFGLIIERLIIRKLYGNPLQSLLATWGVSLVFIQLARTVFGDLTSVKAPALLSGGWHVAPQLVLPYNRIFIIVITLIMISITFLFLYKSKNGLRIRSVTQNRNMSACLGISTERIDAMTFFIGSGIAGIAGCCMTLIGNIVPDMGQTYIVDSFLVVVTGGVGNLFGTVLAGLGIGQFTKILEPIFHAVYGKVIILAIIIFFLQFKPRGLFPPKGRIADD